MSEPLLSATKYPVGSFWIYDNDKLVVRTSPGGRCYSRTSEGKYQYSSFVLGGCGWGSATPKIIAECLWKDHRGEWDSRTRSRTFSKVEAVRQSLRELRWTDVLAEFDRLSETLSENSSKTSSAGVNYNARTNSSDDIAWCHSKGLPVRVYL